MKLKKEYTISEISEIYNCKIQGDPNTIFNSVSSLANSKKKSISFICDKKLLTLLDKTVISCLIATEELSRLISLPMLISAEPLYVFSQIINDSLEYNKMSLFADVIAKNQLIDNSSFIGKNVLIGDNVTIGKNCVIHPNVIIHNDTIINDNVIIQSGAVIGSDGFGLVKHEDHWCKVPHIGNVIIESNVEIGANTTIDRATLDSTIIRNNVKIDNLVHVAHNVIIGNNTAIAACVGIAGSTTIGKNCTIGGGAGINGHIEIADNIHINGMTMVTKSLDQAGQYASGTTVEPASTWRKNQARFKELDKVVKLIKKEVGDKNE